MGPNAAVHAGTPLFGLQEFAEQAWSQLVAGAEGRPAYQINLVQRRLDDLALGGSAAPDRQVMEALNRSLDACWARWLN